VIALCNTGVGEKTKEYYETFVNSSNIMTVFNISAEHAFVRRTLHMTYWFRISMDKMNE